MFGWGVFSGWQTSCVFTWQKGLGSCVGSFVRALISFMRTLPHDLITFERPSPSVAIILGIRILTCEFCGRRETSMHTIVDHHMEQYGYHKSANLLKCLSSFFPSLIHYSCLCQNKSDLLLHELNGWITFLLSRFTILKDNCVCTLSCKWFPPETEMYCWCQDKGQCYYHPCFVMDRGQYWSFPKTSWTST